MEGLELGRLGGLDDGRAVDVGAPTLPLHLRGGGADVVVLVAEGGQLEEGVARLGRLLGVDADLDLEIVGGLSEGVGWAKYFSVTQD